MNSFYSVKTVPFGANTQEDQKSLAAEVLPVLALVVGVPLLMWWADKKQKESFRRA